MGAGGGQNPILQGRKKKCLSGSKCLCVESTSQNLHKKQQRQHRCQAYNFSVGRSRKYVGIEKEEKKKTKSDYSL